MNEAERTLLIDEIVKASREPLPRIQSIVEIEGTDGNWYHPFGLPWGFKGTGRSRIAGYAYSDRNGITYGRKELSEQNLIDGHEAREDRKGAEFRSQLERMSDKKLRSQAEYWLSMVA